ncbi:hypothetical protein QFZ87_003083 [Bacillus sp. SLBN-46]|uniref:hypothetical protein n=1 Tax=Bacillus sp. SLBN-46 TaxID=3042283 RepID=UPI00285E24EA|nr:hypothetical protein [Bacillus sp. SLBN-46]MDR6123486.1 hypothetical protein [Bacillus sp. SLBN-46]
MRIKNGVSMIDLWLKKIKKCQLIQKNWNVSSHLLDLHNEDTIKEVIDSTKDFFYDRYKLNIFRDTVSPYQFLNHGEIDVLGLEIKSGTIANIYGINTTFHDMGFIYLKDNTKMEKIIKNMIRTAMLIHGYYDISKGTIIFAAPDLNPSLQEQLTNAVKLLNELFKVYGFQFTFIHYVNEEYQIQIHNPLKDTQSSVKTSPQVKGIVTSSRNTMVSKMTQQYINKIAVSSDDNEKIGQLVRKEVGKLARNGQLSEEMVQNLLDERYSKETFNLNFPFLRKIEKGQYISKQKFINGYVRYWSEAFVINGGTYIICNNWHERHRTEFLNWLELR